MDPVILEDLRKTFGLEIPEAQTVDGGWLNRKWKARTNRGDFLIKQFSRKRFGDRQLRQIEEALVRQRIAGEAGVPCPTILFAPDGRPMRFLCDSAGTVYMVMTFCEASATPVEKYTVPSRSSRTQVPRDIPSTAHGFPPNSRKTTPHDGTIPLRP